MEALDLHMLAIIAAGAVATYMTRIGGYILIALLSRIPPRLESALNAVPAAVLTTLFAPAFVEGGYDVKLAMGASLIAGLYLSPILMLLVGWGTVMICRLFLGF